MTQSENKTASDWRLMTCDECFRLKNCIEDSTTSRSTYSTTSNSPKGIHTTAMTMTQKLEYTQAHFDPPTLVAEVVAASARRSNT